MSDEIEKIPEGAVRGRHGGWLKPQKAGEPSRSPGRRKNPFREFIRMAAEAEEDFSLLEGFLCDENGKRTKQRVKVFVKIPKVAEIVYEQMKLAKKSVDSARWLSDVGWGKPMMTNEEGDELPLVGFKFVIEDGRTDEP